MCGIVGISGHADALSLARRGLARVQHRGQEGVGLGWSNNGALFVEHRLGLADNLTDAEFAGINARCAIGHVRYAITGHKRRKQNLQPMRATVAPQISLQIAHNGNFTNDRELKAELELSGAVFNSSTDTEVLLHLIARTDPELPMHIRVLQALERIEGAYCLLIMTPTELIAVRDPTGFHPLVRGVLDGGVVYASEDSALNFIGAEFVEEVPAGTMQVVRNDLVSTIALHRQGPVRPCIFELIYIARPDSEHIFGKAVYPVRKAFGRELARSYQPKVDIVVPVPDSGVPASIGYGQALGLPVELGFTRAHHAGRSFIEGDTASREEVVSAKLSPIASALRGMSVYVQEDSIVRGTTLKIVVGLMRRAGAREIHVGVSSPPVIDSCYWASMDTPQREKLAFVREGGLEGVRRFIGADSLGYLDIAGMYRAVDGMDACDGCFTGTYSAPLPPHVLAA